MAQLGSEENPLRVAIVGSGPAGFYAAEQLIKPEGTAVEVDMFDKLPTPFGLVRAGVAPDHPKIKSVIRVYEKTAARPEFRFFGNVTVGEDVTVAELRERYHAVLFAYGSSTDRQLGIPGEDLPGSHSATEFVNWYNAHPDFADHELRPLLRARGRDRQRQRRRRRRPHARPAARGAGGHRHRRPRDRGALQQRGQGDRRARPPRPRPGRLHQPRGARARRDDPGRHRHRPRRDRAGRAQPRLRRFRGLRADQPPQRRDLHRVLPAAGRKARSSGSCCASSAPRSRSRATARSSGS